MKSELNWGQTAIFASFSELKSLPFPAGQVNRPDCTASVFLQNTVVDSSPKRLCTPPPQPPARPLPSDVGKKVETSFSSYIVEIYLRLQESTYRTKTEKT